MTVGGPAFEPLSRLFRGDRGKIRRALDIFRSSTGRDLEELDQAYAAGDRAVIGQLMHKMKSSCLQIGEDTTAEAISRAEHTLLAAPESDAFARAFAAARDELERTQTRVAGYLSTQDEAEEG